MMSDIRKVSDGTSAVGKCRRNLLIPCFWSDLGMEKYTCTPNRARFFMRKKCTTFSTARIVALRSVNRIFSESYDFAATLFEHALEVLKKPVLQVIE
jgi:hypothetical protein